MNFLLISPKKNYFYSRKMKHAYIFLKLRDVRGYIQNSVFIVIIFFSIEFFVDMHSSKFFDLSLWMLCR